MPSAPYVLSPSSTSSLLAAASAAAALPAMRAPAEREASTEPQRAGTAAVSQSADKASSALVPELGADFDHALVVHRCLALIGQAQLRAATVP